LTPAAPGHILEAHQPSEDTMRGLIRNTVVVALAVAFTGAASALQSSPNVKTMAGVLATLNHFPGDAEKAKLEGIVKSESATAAEKTVAQAMINLQHTVAAADKPKLDALIKDQATPASVRTLAEILVRLNHAPSAADKAELTKLSAM
jgi:hypothetical protein